LITAGTNLAVVWVCAALSLPVAMFALAPVVALLNTAAVGAILALRNLRLPATHLLQLASGLTTRDAYRLVKGTAAPLLVISVITPLNFQLDRIILSHLGSPGALADYALVAQFYAPSFAIIFTAGLALWPYFTKAQAKGRFVRQWVLALGAFATVGVLAGTVLIFSGPSATDWLSGGTRAPAQGLYVLFGLLLLAQTVNVPASMLLTGAWGATRQARVLILATIVNLGCSLALTPHLQASGPVAGSLIAVGLVQVPGCLYFSGRTARRGAAGTESQEAT
jgi:O-antigen/teichoic acid export membrane protein